METSGQRRDQDKERSGQGDIRTRRHQDKERSGLGEIRTGQYQDKETLGQFSGQVYFGERNLLQQNPKRRNPFGPLKTTAFCNSQIVAL